MRFTIGFEKKDTMKLHRYWDEIIDKQQWSEGYFTQTFEEKWSEYNNLNSVAFSSWGGAALAALEFFNIKGKTVLCPSNTFMATPLAAIKAGNRVEFVDCNKEDLCLSFEDLKAKIDIYKPARYGFIQDVMALMLTKNPLFSCQVQGIFIVLQK